MKKLFSLKISSIGLLLASLTLIPSCKEASITPNTILLQETSQKKSVFSKQEKKLILFFGNNVSKYGLSAKQTFPSLIQQRIDSLRFDFEVINAGLIDGSSTEARKRINWMLNQDIDIFVLELGINDRMAGIPIKQTQENIQAIIDTVQSRNPNTTIVLAGVEYLPAGTYSIDKGMPDLYSDLVTDYKVPLSPCIYELANNIQESNLYSTKRGQQILADNVWKVLQPLMVNNSITSNY